MKFELICISFSIATNQCWKFINLIGKREEIRNGWVDSLPSATRFVTTAQASRSLATHLKDKSVGINVVLSTKRRGRANDTLRRTTRKERIKHTSEARNCFYFVSASFHFTLLSRRGRKNRKKHTQNLVNSLSCLLKSVWERKNWMCHEM